VIIRARFGDANKILSLGIKPPDRVLGIITQYQHQEEAAIWRPTWGKYRPTSQIQKSFITPIGRNHEKVLTVVEIHVTIAIHIATHACLSDPLSIRRPGEIEITKVRGVGQILLFT